MPVKTDRALRIVIAGSILAGFVIAMAALFFLTESALAVWDRLRNGPAWIFYGYFPGRSPSDRCRDLG